MKELEFIETIKSMIGDKYIGDDCAYLKDLGIVVSQDSLVENIHFKMDYMTPFELGFKSVTVNLSDISASGAIPKYLSIALSLPKYINNDFITEFYQGAKSACNEVEIIGGDITGSEKIMVSICVIGKTKGCKISSRKHAQSNQIVVTTGVHGSSSAGLELLLSNKTEPKSLINSHIKPVNQFEFAQSVSKNINENYAMMDTSDGLADALFKISKASNKNLIIDFNKIRYDENIKKVFPENYKEKILYGGEDYQIVATVPKSILNRLKNCYPIGIVEDVEDKPVVKIIDNNKTFIIDNLNKCFEHFEN